MYGAYSSQGLGISSVEKDQTHLNLTLTLIRVRVSLVLP